MTEKARFSLFVDLPGAPRLQAADIVIIEDAGHVDTVGFRYCQPYLDSASPVAFDPVHLPLATKEFQLHCRGGIPAIVDDYLPDDWGRRVLSYAHLKQTGKKMNARSAIACIKALQRSRIGALEITAPGEAPAFDLGIDWDDLERAEAIGQDIDRLPFEEIPSASLDLIYLANEGSGVGGARPKTLVHRGGEAFLAKFNRSADAFNYARTELACLKMAQAAGIDIYPGEVQQSVNGRDVLLLRRFDINNGHRRHMLTINGLRKDRYHRDDVGVFRYDDIVELLRRHSVNFANDAEQLLRVMLFNRAIHNTDDHERNFSLINDGEGYRLSPAYDLVPTLTTGNYHVAGYQYSAYPLTPTEALSAGKVFGLNKVRVRAIAEQVIEAVSQWDGFASDQAVSDTDHAAVASVITL